MKTVIRKSVARRAGPPVRTSSTAQTLRKLDAARAKLAEAHQRLAAR